MKNKRVYNKSSLNVDTLTSTTCPQCRGDGYISKYDSYCSLCEGKGKVWYNQSSGLALPLYVRKSDINYRTKFY